MGDIVLAGATSGTITLTPTATAGSSTLTLPAANGTVITTASSGQSIPKAALPTGSVLQVQTYNSTGAIQSTSSAITLLTASFTPTSATSKVLAMMTVTVERQGGGTGNYIFIGLNRNGSAISSGWADALGYQQTTGARSVSALNFLDSPATASAISYTYVGDFSVSGNVPWQFYKLNLTLLEIAA